MNASASQAIYRGHLLATVVGQARTGRLWADIMGGKHLPHVVSTLGSARVATRIKGNIWGLSVSDLTDTGCGDPACLRGQYCG